MNLRQGQVSVKGNKKIHKRKNNLKSVYDFGGIRSELKAIWYRFTGLTKGAFNSLNNNTVNRYLNIRQKKTGLIN